MKFRFKFSLLFVEALLLASLVLTLVLYKFFGLPLRTPYELYFGKLGQNLALYSLGLLLAAFYIRFSRISLGEDLRDSIKLFAEGYLKASLIFFDLRLVHAISLLFFIFIQLKHLTPLVSNNLYDQWFIDSEKSFFAGGLIGVHLQNLLGPGAADFLSSSYTAFYPYMAFLLLSFILKRDPILSEKFILAFCLTWLAGIVLIYAVPTWGPCFYDPSTFANLPYTHVSELQQSLWAHKIHLDKNPLSATGVFLISGFPSLHLAIPVLGSLYSYRRMRAVFYLSALMSLLTLASTLYFAWHYFLDDLGAIALAGLVFLICRPSKKL